jgi:hypothetical protein
VEGKRTEVRQRLAQEIITDPGNYRAIEEFNTKHQRRVLRLELPFAYVDSATLADELRATTHNLALESVVYMAQLSALQVNIQGKMIDITHGLLYGQKVPSNIYEGTSVSLRGDFPTPVRALSERLSGILSEATIGAGREEPAHLYAQAKMNLLHARARELLEHLTNRNYEDIPSVASRIQVFEPLEARLFTIEEREAILGGYIDSNEVVARLNETGMVESSQKLDQDINGAFFTSLLFAASHAIEVKHPGISPRDTTRLLLYNADQLGGASHSKLDDALYAFMVTGGEETRGTFPWLTHLATDAQKMQLNDDDRLQLPLSPRSRGVCPISYTYTLQPEYHAYFQEFNSDIEQLYDVAIPKTVGDFDLVLATQFSLMGALYGEPCINGRTHAIVQDFFNGDLGALESNQFLERH